MLSKYHVNTVPTPSRFAPIPKFCAIENEGCIGCRHCVKREACVYDVYKKREFLASEFADTTDVLCVACLRCVQECKKNIILRSFNPRHTALGNHYWTPEIITSLIRQAETGDIPVSGAGYRGPFTGSGFDAMWTDMSEIVRPTRDGIHGREYISTVIELGRKPAHLRFTSDGGLITEGLPFVEVAVPFVLKIPDCKFVSSKVKHAFLRAAQTLNTLVVLKDADIKAAAHKDLGHVILERDGQQLQPPLPEHVGVVEIPYTPDWKGVVREFKSQRSDLVVLVRVPFDGEAEARIIALAAEGAEVLHLQAETDGMGRGGMKDVFVADFLRDLHLKLTELSLRNQITLLVSGGIAMAEHMAKAIICGADGVVLDLAPLVALECRVCADCHLKGACPVSIDQVEEAWGAQRIVNLLHAWHSQIIEVMGAMGIREVRRMRGEHGRLMLFEDLQRDNLAGLVKEGGCMAPSLEASADVTAWFESPPSLGPAAKPCPSRFRNRINRFRVVRLSSCIKCGRCAEICTAGVFKRAGDFLVKPASQFCVGAEVCSASGSCCLEACPVSALRMGRDPVSEVIGDRRWTPDLLMSTWEQAHTGRPPREGLEFKTGASDGGFDRIAIISNGVKNNRPFHPDEINIGLSLNRRGEQAGQVAIGVPFYGGGMSYGSISLATMISRAKAYSAFDSFMCTGEGGFPDELLPYKKHVITQVATGLFGVREETIQHVRIVEFKYAQGAKPGLGGHLLGDKVTQATASLRESVAGVSLFSPFPFHSVYSVEDHKKHIDWIKAINPDALVSVKVSGASDVDMVAVGSYCAGAHIVHLDGSYGGTGAAPDIAKKNIAMPIEYAIPKVHRFLVNEGVRDKITLIASGGIRTAWDMAKIIALGADGIVIGTAELVALECVRCGVCERGRGCPRGIATTDDELSSQLDIAWGTQRLINLFSSFSIQLKGILWGLGMKDVGELVGRTDVLRHLIT
ncbi:MAG: alpha-hydroxy-acid oxidizing protein [Deltaproteobacteria bacterium]|nr:alpha-hydroxy-acid oxidizing protein [Deltaproteobacteria bacterium]